MAIDQEIKDFLDHMRTTCVEERQVLKLEVRRLRSEVRRAYHRGWEDAMCQQHRAAHPDEEER
jgi:hypothetical protein